MCKAPCWALGTQGEEGSMTTSAASQSSEGANSSRCGVVDAGVDAPDSHRGIKNSTNALYCGDGSGTGSTGVGTHRAPLK